MFWGPKRGVFGGPKIPPPAPGRPGPRPRNFPPGPRARPGRPPRGTPPGPPSGTPPGTPPEGYPQDPDIWPCHGRAHDMAIDRSSHSVLVLKIAMWCERCALFVDRTWRSIGSRTACSSSRSPCGGDALRALSSAVMTPCPRHLQLAPVCPGLRPLRSGSSLRVPASSLPAASGSSLSPDGSADWVAESGALHYRALLSAQTVVGEPPHPAPVPAGGPADPLPRP